MNKPGLFEEWKKKTELLKRETYALYLAYQDPRVPWFSKAFAALVVGYALSPIDLIPDFIPILGYLDDLILIPIGIAIARRIIPEEIMDECREQARERLENGLPHNWYAAIIIIGIWSLILTIIILYLLRLASSS
jgi:uncharacterized membrane protein YkvA (DUF1232 family)